MTPFEAFLIHAMIVTGILTTLRLGVAVLKFAIVWADGGWSPPATTQWKRIACIILGMTILATIWAAG